MLIRGYFPDFSQMTYQGPKVYRFKDGYPTSRELVSPDSLMTAIRGTVLSAASRDASIYLIPEPTEHFGPFGCSFAGVPVEPPAQKIVELYPRVSTNNGSRWRARKRTKEIILSPFITGQVQISYAVGRVFTPLQKPIQREKFLARTGLFSVYKQNTQWITVNGLVYETGSIHYPATFGKSEQTVFPSFPEVEYLDHLRNNIGVSKDGAMVMACLSSANRGTIDALTAAAEFPETLRSILDLIKSCVSIYKDARIKSFRIYNKGKANSDVLQSQATIAKNARELADAVANVWLNFRYNITPNVMLIEDLVKTLNLELKEFLRFRETKNTPPVLPQKVISGWKIEDQSLNCTERVMIKRLIDLTSKFPKIKHLVLSNVAVTGYELVPFSFVFDWFVNLGDAIAAFAVFPDIRQEGSTYSWKYNGSVTFVHTETQAKVNFDVRAYKLDLINPKSVSCLAFNPDLEGDRTKDAIALTWSVFKNNIMNAISRVVQSPNK